MTIRHDWQLPEVLALFNQPFNDLIFEAQTIHRQNFLANKIQISTLLSIKTGSCPEDCKYCPQSAHYNTNLQKEPLLNLTDILTKAQEAKDSGASRFCMGAAWRNLHDRDLPKMVEVIKAVKNLGLETCVTLGMLTQNQAFTLKNAGLDYYNHNIDTSPEHYKHIISTRTFQDRLDTIENIRNANIKLCCGGIIGMGESIEDRLSMLITLANFNPHPESVPINLLIKVKGTPLEHIENVNIFDFIRTIAVARIIMPQSVVRLSAGRETMTDEAQALCFMAGANSLFYGEKLLTTKNPDADHDTKLFNTLGLEAAATA
ncbi:Biotin synthase [Rickettsiales bacterium Ac37b]|nr:Biotin synthase [Rickettsiales bacterium Ac37b]